MPKEKARRVVVHDPTGFSSFSEAQGWPTLFLGQYSFVLGTGDLPAEALPSAGRFSGGGSAGTPRVLVVCCELTPSGPSDKTIPVGHRELLRR